MTVSSTVDVEDPADASDAGTYRPTVADGRRTIKVLEDTGTIITEKAERGVAASRQRRISATSRHRDDGLQKSTRSILKKSAVVPVMPPLNTANLPVNELH